MAFFIYTFMTNDEFKENIRGILIELSEKKLIKFFIQKNYIRIFSFYIDISDYLLTLYDFLDMNGFTDLEFESYSANDEYKKVKISDIKNIRKMGIHDITLYFKDTKKVITESNKFDNIKNIITNIDGILVGLKDSGFNYEIYPSDNDIKLKMVSFAKEKIKVKIELLKKYDKSQIFDIVYTLNDYMESNNFKTLPISTDAIRYKRLVRLNFNSINDLEESDLDIVTLYLEYENMDKLLSESISSKDNKFENVKDLLTNIEGILVELDDLNISYRIYPINNDIKIKMVSLGKEDIQIDITFDKEYNRTLVYSTLETLCDLMKYNNYKLTISTKEFIKNPIEGYSKLKYEKYYDISELNIRNVYQINLRFENLNKILSESISSRISDNLEGLIVDLEDYGFDCELSGNKLKLVKPDIMFGDKIRNIFDSILTIVDFMESSGYKPIVYYNEDNRKTFTKKWFEDDINSIKLSFMYYIDSLTIEFSKPINESLPRENTVKQLKRIRKLSKGTDIGDRISDMNKQGANIDYINNPIDTGVESYEDYEKKNKDFIPSWNLKHLLDPFQYSKKKKKKKK